MALTKRFIDSLKYAPGGPNQQVAWDGKDLPGFGVRVYPTGRKSFILSYRTRSGRSRIMTLGKYGVLTLDQARTRARRELVRVAEGADPVAEKKADQGAATMGELADLWLERHAKAHRKGGYSEDKRRTETHVKPSLGHLPVASVKRSDVLSLHSKIGAKRPIEANRTIELIRAMLNKAEEWGIVPEGTPNPATKVKRFKEKSRRRFVSPAEMPELLKAIDAEDNVFIKAALKLYLLTGLRKNELLRSKWKDIDLESREWRVVRKGAEDDTVPLSIPAAAILESLPRFVNNEHVFPGQRKGAPLTDINKAWRAVRKAAGVEDVTLHDLRRTLGSWMATAGVPLQIIGQALGHAEGDVEATAIYSRLQRHAARQALEDHASRLLGLHTD